MSYLNKYSDNDTPQTSQRDPRQEKNNAGGYVYTLDIFEQLTRFLIIGTEGGSYYVGEQEATLSNIKVVDECLSKDPIKTLELAAAVSSAGRAPKNDQAIYVLAKGINHHDHKVRELAEKLFPSICRIPTHIFMLAEMLKNEQTRGDGRGWGRSLRRLFASYYKKTPVHKLMTHLLKYRNREGWTHADLIRKSHPKVEGDRSALIKFALTGENTLTDEKLRDTIAAFETINTMGEAMTSKEVIALVEKFGFQREMLPSKLQSDPEIQKAIWGNLGYTALMRNLANFTKSGMITQSSNVAKEIAKTLMDAEKIKKSMVHPLQILLGAKTYASGHSLRGDGSWSPVSTINSALDTAFELAFGNVNIGDKRILVALDYSGSMDTNISGFPISSREVASAIALPLWKSSPDNVTVVGFSSKKGHEYRWSGRGLENTEINRLEIENYPTLAGFNRYVSDLNSKLPFGGTDCALPYIWAKEQNMKFDAVIVITDNETYQGKVHVDVAKKRYDKSIGRTTKMVVIGTTATKYTIAAPEFGIGESQDSNVLNIAGFDGSIASLVTEFVTGKLGSTGEVEETEKE